MAMKVGVGKREIEVRVLGSHRIEIVLALF